MSRMANRRGLGLIDVILTFFLLGIVGLVFASTFPAGFSAMRQAQDYKLVASIAERKMEQIRALNYESLTYTSFMSAGIIDTSPTTSPYQFTVVDKLYDPKAGLGYTDINGNKAYDPGEELAVGSVAVEDMPGSGLRKVTVTIEWQGASKTGPKRNFQLSTLFADRRTRK